MTKWISKSAKGANTAYLKVGIWYDPDKDHIHVAVPKSDWFITTVSNDPSSKRGHPNLYGKLARALREAGVPGPSASDEAE